MTAPLAAAAAERSLAAATARWLAAGRSSAGALGLACAALTLGALLWRAPAAAPLLWAVLALAPLERLLALRLHFDGGLFADLARAEGPMPGALAALDHALHGLRLRRPAQAPRPLAERVRGAQRLLHAHLGCVAVQFAALAAAGLAPRGGA